MQCKFKASHGEQCTREADKGSTTCKRHRTAGISRKHWNMMQEKKRQREGRRY